MLLQSVFSFSVEERRGSVTSDTRAKDEDEALKLRSWLSWGQRLFGAYKLGSTDRDWFALSLLTALPYDLQVETNVSFGRHRGTFA